ncbi:MAG TPA: ankyrin repeat domain-containing protein [Gammaproteobacteria bacterium]|nr:ankyrin repeat domain-containing protein [Gammaproteobacteria bacterium]
MRNRHQKQLPASHVLNFFADENKNNHLLAQEYIYIRIAELIDDVWDLINFSTASRGLYLNFILTQYSRMEKPFLLKKNKLREALPNENKYKLLMIRTARQLIISDAAAASKRPILFFIGMFFLGYLAKLTHKDMGNAEAALLVILFSLVAAFFSLAGSMGKRKFLNFLDELESSLKAFSVNRRRDIESLLDGFNSPETAKESIQKLSRFLDVNQAKVAHRQSEWLFYWCHQGDAHRVKLLLEEMDLSVIDSLHMYYDIDFMTPLIVASSKGHHNIVELLLNAGANPSRQSKDQHITPLFVAANRLSVLSVQHLLHRGASVFVIYCADDVSQNLLDYLSSSVYMHNPEDTPKDKEARLAILDLVLFAAIRQINSADLFDQFIDVAIRFNRVEVIKAASLFFSEKPFRWAINQNALISCIELNNADAAIALIGLQGRVAHVNQAMFSSKASLFQSAQAEKGAIPRVFDPNYVNESGQTPLMAAILCNQAAVAIALLHAGANPNDACANIGSPLFCAIARLNVEVVDALINAGVDLNAGNFDERNALAYAEQQKFELGENKEKAEAIIELIKTAVSGRRMRL